MTNLAIIKGWDRFDEILYHRYLKTINNVDNTLSGIHARSVEENQQDRRSRLMELLQDKSRGINTIARYLGVSYRTVYRYFELFKTLGYSVDKNTNNKYKLKK